MASDLPHRWKFGGIAAGTERRRSEMKWTEITGAELNKPFKVAGLDGEFAIIEYYDNRSQLIEVVSRVPSGDILAGCSLTPNEFFAIIHAAPSGIIHLPPPLTDEQRVVLMSLFTIGARYMGMSREGWKRCFVNKPQKEFSGWTCGDTQALTIAHGMANCLDSLVSWSDPEPYDIAKAMGVTE